MSDRADMPTDEHLERWGDEIAAYALDALDPPERETFVAHMEGCEACRERLRWLAPAIDVLPATVPQQQPPAALKARLMDVVEREAEPPPVPERPAERSRRPSWFLGLTLRPALAGMAVVLVLVAGAVGYAIHDSGGDGDPTQTFAAEGAGSDKGATGTLEVEGDAGSLHVDDLPPTRRGQVYQAWIRDRGRDGAVQPSSVFVVSADGVGDVAIPHGLADAKLVMVTREPKGGSEEPSGGAVLTAEMG